MDGSFLELDGESMKVQLDEFYREIFKMLKFFQQKQIKAAQEMEKISGMTRETSSEQDQAEQESPSAAVRSTVTEKIKSAQEMKDISMKTRQSPREEDLKKQESPTIVLCSTVMKQIKKFQVIYATNVLNVFMTEISWQLKFSFPN